jgi:hypothetical protein
VANPKRWAGSNICAYLSLARLIYYRTTIAKAASIVGIDHAQSRRIEMGAAGSLRCTSRFKQKPSAALRLVDPNLKQACGSDVAVLATQIVRLTHACH